MSKTGGGGGGGGGSTHLRPDTRLGDEDHEGAGGPTDVAGGYEGEESTLTSSGSSASSSAPDDESEATRQHLRDVGAVPEEELEEQHRQAIREGQYFVGFYNATLFLISEERDVTLFTEGISGCTGLILIGSKGTYMAHIDSKALGGAHSDDVSNSTKAVIATYESQIGVLPEKAIVVTDKEADVHVGMMAALEGADFDQENDYYIGSRFAINVGSMVGHLNHLEGTRSTVEHNKVGMEVHNLVPEEQRSWGTMLAEVARTRHEREEARTAEHGGGEEAGGSRAEYSSTHRDRERDRERDRDRRGYRGDIGGHRTGDRRDSGDERAATSFRGAGGGGGGGSRAESSSTHRDRERGRERDRDRRGYRGDIGGHRTGDRRDSGDERAATSFRGGGGGGGGGSRAESSSTHRDRSASPSRSPSPLRTLATPRQGVRRDADRGGR